MQHAVSAVRNTCFAILSSIETDLREFIAEAAISGGDVEILPTDVRLAASNRYALDNKETLGGQPQNDLDLLDYTDFADLAKMLRLKKALLTDQFGCDLDPIAVQIEGLAGARNRVCHSRPLEEDDLPNFIDLATFLLTKFRNMPWRELVRIQDLRTKDPSYILRLQIPDFWRADTKSVPHNLPLPDFDETSFLGRVSERREVRKLILNPHPVITIIGEGGVGKTALAVNSLYEILELTDQPPFDAIIWVSLKTKALTSAGVVEIRDAIGTTLGLVKNVTQWLGASTEDAATFDVLTKELTDYLEQFRVLLVIDNFETVNARLLRPLLSSVPRGSKVLITSRIGLGELEIRFKLDPLDQKTANSLARKYAKCLNLELLSSAPDQRLERYTEALFRNPLLIKWFVQSVVSGADPERLIGKRGVAFETALRFCFENLFSRLSTEEKEILHFLAAARRPLTPTELQFLLQETCSIDQTRLEFALNTLHNSSMLRRIPADPRRQETATQITLTDIASEYIARLAPPDRKMFEKTQGALKKLRALVEKSATQQAVYKFNLYAIHAETRDELICAAYLNSALQVLASHDTIGARKKIIQAKELLPTYSESYRIAALIEGRSGDLYKADEENQTAIQHNPKSVIARYQYALFHLDTMEDAPRALEELEPAIKLDPDDPTLQTMRAMILTRLGRCREAATIYEKTLGGLAARPRKWRIATRSQAADCLRRLAEQDKSMEEFTAAREHLARAYAIIEDSLDKDDFDSRMLDQYKEVFEEAMFLAIDTKDEAYATAQIERLNRVTSKGAKLGMRVLRLETLERCFGPESPPVIAARNLTGQVVWVSPRDDAQEIRGSVRIAGVVKYVPPAMTYGFVTDESGVDWFMHRSSLRHPHQWPSVAAGRRVTFVGVRDRHGRGRTDDVEMLASV